MKYVSYKRVSTKKQGESELGLQAQESVIAAFITAQKGERIADFTEIETGTSKRRRIIIYEAIQTAKLHKATLIVSKVDRLGRNFKILTELKESGIQFISCDNPSDLSIVLNVLMSVAEFEATQISDRVKAALNQKRERGEPLGNPNIRDLAGTSIATRRRMRELNANIKGAKEFLSKYSKGKSACQLAKELAQYGMKTAKGKDFSHTQVLRLLREIAA